MKLTKILQLFCNHVLPAIISSVLYLIGGFMIIGGVYAGQQIGFLWSILGALFIIIILIWQISRTLSHLASDGEVRFYDVIKEYEEHHCE